MSSPIIPSSGANPAIAIRGLKKSYNFKPVLRRLDLTLPEGACMALLGANGAGKTTLLRILAGLTRPGSGTVTIYGLDAHRDAQAIRHKVGFVGHQPYLYEELTALENLLFFARMYGVDHAEERARSLLARVGLTGRSDERVSAFSRGLTQRLAWARALLHAPQLLLLDESETGLDQSGHELIAELLTEHTAQGGTVLFTTHHLEQAFTLSNRIVILAQGRVHWQQETAVLSLDELKRIYREVSS